MTNTEKTTLEFRRALGRRISAQKFGAASETLEFLNSDLLLHGLHLCVVGPHKTLLMLVLFKQIISIEALFVVDMCAEFVPGGTWFLRKNRFGNTDIIVDMTWLLKEAKTG